MAMYDYSVLLWLGDHMLQVSASQSQLAEDVEFFSCLCCSIWPISSKHLHSHVEQRGLSCMAMHDPKVLFLLETRNAKTHRCTAKFLIQALSVLCSSA